MGWYRIMTKIFLVGGADTTKCRYGNGVVFLIILFFLFGQYNQTDIAADMNPMFIYFAHFFFRNIESFHFLVRALRCTLEGLVGMPGPGAGLPDVVRDVVPEHLPCHLRPGSQLPGSLGERKHGSCYVHRVTWHHWTFNRPFWSMQWDEKSMETNGRPRLPTHAADALHTFGADGTVAEDGAEHCKVHQKLCSDRTP